jgi:SNF2 family DNA or RNA helicase
MDIVDLKPHTLVAGLIPGEVVEVTSVQEIGEQVVLIYFRNRSGELKSNTYTREQLSEFEISTQDSKFSFDAQADDFKLATEAMRMQLAGLFDPMAAVNSSDLEPLPHQIRAVYGEFLPRVPLRFLLADDPGAGKTIMAGLYIKELILRGYLKRCLIVVPGGLIDQWKEELFDKFGLSFETLTKNHLSNVEVFNPFLVNNFLIARMDQLSRAGDQVNKAMERANWDLIIVDEAHRMSAHYASWRGEQKATRRYKLGKLLSKQTVNLLLMTATPHAGNDENFELFMALLDEDRFEGKRKKGNKAFNPDGLMRRMVKEDLLTFEGKPLFPERIAETVEYELSTAEQGLYDAVTDYVQREMGRAANAANKKKSNNVGFALTVLQRRLASSPRAILRSLERRQAKLQDLLNMLETASAKHDAPLKFDSSDQVEIPDLDDIDDEEMSDSEREVLENGGELDVLTASQTVDELKAELLVLSTLVANAKVVNGLQEDKKWLELKDILTTKIEGDADAEVRKFIVFTEHKDTLDYLKQKISDLISEEAVISIHGGLSRNERTSAKESFTNNPEVQVLVATDAAGEGLNLQRAHLMVNYDLPWNPNRIEQRFGRIHRIGQTEVCRLWNLVAKGTREGYVFSTLLAKIAQQSVAYNGNLFNVLGQGAPFQDQSLRDLLIEAVRHGNDPKVRAKMETVIDAGVAAGQEELRAEKALYEGLAQDLDAEQIRREMEELQTRRLQPGFISGFFRPAYRRLTGLMTPRDTGRYELKKVPLPLIEFASQKLHLAPISAAYERVTFDRRSVKVNGEVNAHLIAPGSALMAAVVEKTLEDLDYSIRQGSVLVDRSDKQRTNVSVLFALQQEIKNSRDEIVDRHFDFIEVDADGTGQYSNMAPYIDYEAPTDAELELIRTSILETISAGELERRAVEIAAEKMALTDKPALLLRISGQVKKIRIQVEERLDQEIAYWHNEFAKLSNENSKQAQDAAIRAKGRAIELELRKTKRLEELKKEETLISGTALIRTAALVVPASLLIVDENIRQQFAKDQEAIKAVERRAVDLVLKTERELGRVPHEMPRNNKGFDVISRSADGHSIFIEVKGRIEGSDTFHITGSELSFGQTQGMNHRLAIVRVSASDQSLDELRYIADPFADLHMDAKIASMELKWKLFWDLGSDPRA